MTPILHINCDYHFFSLFHCSLYSFCCVPRLLQTLEAKRERKKYSKLKQRTREKKYSKNFFQQILFFSINIKININLLQTRRKKRGFSFLLFFGFLKKTLI